jgi:hypothetical protein
MEAGERFQQNQSLAFSDTHTFRNIGKSIRNDWFKTGEQDKYLLFSYNPKDGSSGSVIEVVTPKPRTVMQELKDLADKGDAMGYATKYLQMANVAPSLSRSMDLSAGLLIIGEVIKP